jgi:hypothetical protein
LAEPAGSTCGEELAELFEVSGSSPGALVRVAALLIAPEGVATISTVAEAPDASAPTVQLTVRVTPV